MTRQWFDKSGRKEIARYLLVGCALYVGSLILMAGLTDGLGLGEVLAYAVLQVLISCAGFVVARLWVFRARSGRLAIHAGRYVVSSITFRVLNFAVYSMLWILLALPREIGILVTLALLFPLKYAVERTLVFTRLADGQPR